MANKICTTVAAWLHICQIPTQDAIVTNSLCRRTKFRPSSIAGQKARCTLLGVSLTGTPRSMEAEINNRQASANNAMGAPAILMSAPAAAGPVTSAVAEASAFFACASTRRGLGTICVNTICAALPAVVLTAPMRKATTYSQGMESQPNHHATGTVATPQAIDSSPIM